MRQKRNKSVFSEWERTAGLVPCGSLTVRSSLSMMACREDFIESRDTFQCLDDAVFQKRSHSMQPGNAADGLRRFSFEGHFAESGVHLHQLEEPEPSAK